VRNPHTLDVLLRVPEGHCTVVLQPKAVSFNRQTLPFSHASPLLHIPPTVLVSIAVVLPSWLPHVAQFALPVDTSSTPTVCILMLSANALFYGREHADRHIHWACVLTPSMQHSPSCEANRVSARKEIPPILRNLVSLPHSQVPATCPYPEPDQSSPCPQIQLPIGPS